MKTQFGVKIAGTGQALPETVVTNDDLTKILDTTNEWIVQRTGIKERRRAKAGESTAGYGAKAAKLAIETAGVALEEIGMVLFATVTPDYRLPFCAALVQRELGLVNAGGFDVTSGCAGFVQAFQTGSQFIRTGACQAVLVIGADLMSTIIDPRDRSTAVLFGDGAGAMVLTQAGAEETSDLLAMTSGLQGDDDVLVIPDGGARHPITQESIDAGRQFVVMKGRNVFRFAVDRLTTQIEQCCQDAGIQPSDLKLLVPHQVNLRIIESAVRRLAFDLSKVVINLDRLGNTSGATVPMALHEAIRAGRVERGDYVMFVAFGSGLAWAAALFQY